MILVLLITYTSKQTKHNIVGKEQGQNILVRVQKMGAGDADADLICENILRCRLLLETNE